MIQKDLCTSSIVQWSNSINWNFQNKENRQLENVRLNFFTDNGRDFFEIWLWGQSVKYKSVDSVKMYRQWYLWSVYRQWLCEVYRQFYSQVVVAKVFKDFEVKKL